jgi:hypothetical protein
MSSIKFKKLVSGRLSVKVRWKQDGALGCKKGKATEGGWWNTQHRMNL